MVINVMFFKKLYMSNSAVKIIIKLYRIIRMSIKIIAIDMQNKWRVLYIAGGVFIKVRPVTTHWQVTWRRMTEFHNDFLLY